MKIFSTQQLYQADEYTLKRQNISSDILMERAADRLFEWIHSRFREAGVKFYLFCGTGNNGGDGLALARRLYDQGHTVAIYVLQYSNTPSQDFLLNLERLKERNLKPEMITRHSALPPIAPAAVVVDAIFGLGLNRPPEPWVAHLIAHINLSPAFVISVDMPSGLAADPVFPVAAVVRANQVLTFQTPKLVFFLPETGKYIQQWEVLDIGLDADFLQNTETTYTWINQSEVLPLYRSRNRFSHKGTYGHAVLVGGSYGKTGAVHLAGKACLTAGSGLVTVFVPQCGYLPLQTALPELMVLTDEEEKHITSIAIPFVPKAIGIGMGMGTHGETVGAFSEFLKHARFPLVVDADALNILAAHPELLTELPAQSVLTPHPGELERLIGGWKNDFDKLAKAKAFSARHNCVLLLKGAYTITIYQHKGYVNSTGNPGMAGAGSGDVLTGMLTGLLAQGYTPLQAAVFGVYLHGLAGDKGAAITGYEALTACGIIKNIGKAYREFYNVLT